MAGSEEREGGEERWRGVVTLINVMGVGARIKVAQWVFDMIKYQS